MSKLGPLLLLFFAGCSKTAAPAAPEIPAAETVAQADADEPQVEPEKFTTMGAWIVGETMSMRVVEATVLPQLEAGTSVAMPPANHHFVRVQVEIENRGVTPQRVRAKRFTLRDKAGRDNSVSATHQATFAMGSDELLLVPGMREPFELIFTLHNSTVTELITFEDAMTRLVGEVRATEPVPPRKKRTASGKAKSAP